jgi:hypothetical protein
MTMKNFFLLAGLIFGLFAFSQIVFPLFSAWPRAKQLEREGKLIKPVPIATFIVAPIVWGAILLGTILLVKIYFDEYANFYFVALGFILVVVIAQIPKQKRNPEAGFMKSWQRYLKEWAIAALQENCTQAVMECYSVVIHDDDRLLLFIGLNTMKFCSAPRAKADLWQS